MNEEVQLVLDTAKESMQGAIDHLKNELTKIRAGKANPTMLDSVVVDYYGASTPLNQVANVSTLDGRTISVQPWEKQLLEDIEKAIINANLGLNPQNNGEMIIITVPTLTEERRKELTKHARSEGEHAKVSIRNARKDANDAVKDFEKEGMPEDEAKRAEESVQKLTDEYATKADQLVEAKEKDILTV